MKTKRKKLTAQEKTLRAFLRLERRVLEMTNNALDDSSGRLFGVQKELASLENHFRANLITALNAGLLNIINGHAPTILWALKIQGTKNDSPDFARSCRQIANEIEEIIFNPAMREAAVKAGQTDPAKYRPPSETANRHE